MSVIQAPGESRNLAAPECLGVVGIPVYTPEGMMRQEVVLDGPVVVATKGEDPSWMVGMFPGREYPDAIPSAAGIIRRGSVFEILHAHRLRNSHEVTQVFSGLFGIDAQEVIATLAENGEVVQPHVRKVGATCVSLYVGDFARTFLDWRKEAAKLRRVEGHEYESEWELAHSVRRAMILSAGREQLSLVAPDGDGMPRNRQQMFPAPRPYTRGVDGHR